jgi:O-antigen ligase
VLILPCTFLDNFLLLGLPFFENLSSVVGSVLIACFAFMRWPAARLWEGPAKYFVLYLVVSAVIEGGHSMRENRTLDLAAWSYYFQYAQTVVLYLIFRDLFRDSRLVKWCAVAFLVSATLLSLVGNLGISGLAGGAAFNREGDLRVGFRGMNLNYQAVVYSIALTGITCWIVPRWPRIGTREVLLLAAGASMLFAHVRTGSRGGLAALVVGLGAAMLLMFQTRRWLAYLMIVPLILYGVGRAVVGSSVLRARVEETVYGGNTGARIELATLGWHMLRERPLLGWGATHSQELGVQVGKQRKAVHNTYLQLLLSFGVIGFTPWLAGVTASLLRTWRSRSTFWATTLCSVLVVMLVGGVVANYGYNKMIWLLLAAAGGTAFPTKGRATGRRLQADNPRPVSASAWPGQRWTGERFPS